MELKIRIEEGFEEEWHRLSNPETGYLFYTKYTMELADVALMKSDVKRIKAQLNNLMLDRFGGTT